MGLIVLKKISLLFLLISASLLATSLAGRQLTSMDNPAVVKRSTATTNEETTRKSLPGDEASEVHERLLGANTKDYGSYNPSPTFVKPPFKLIPN